MHSRFSGTNAVNLLWPFDRNISRYCDKSIRRATASDEVPFSVNITFRTVRGINHLVTEHAGDTPTGWNDGRNLSNELDIFVNASTDFLKDATR